MYLYYRLGCWLRILSNKVNGRMCWILSYGGRCNGLGCWLDRNLRIPMLTLLILDNDICQVHMGCSHFLQKGCNFVQYTLFAESLL